MKNVLLIGLGRFGRHIAKQLNQLGHEIMVTVPMLNFYVPLE